MYSTSYSLSPPPSPPSPSSFLLPAPISPLPFSSSLPYSSDTVIQYLTTANLYSLNVIRKESVLLVYS